MQEVIRIALIDRYQLFREGVKLILESDDLYQIVAEGEQFSIFQEAMSQSNVDVLLIDVDILNQHEEEVKHFIEDQDIKVIVFANNGEEAYVTKAIKIGVHGFLLKEMDKSSFIEAIQLVLNGTDYIHPNATHNLVEDYLQLVKLGNNDMTNVIEEVPHKLYSKREGEILQLLVDGQSNRKIAEILNISEKTVKNHVSSLFKKLQVNDRTKAAVMAIRNNWVSL